MLPCIHRFTKTRHTRSTGKSWQQSRPYLAAIPFAIFFAFPVQAGWQPINVGGGGWFERISIGADGRVYAASDLSGIYVSADQGAHWSILGPAQGMYSTHVAGFGMHPTDGQRVFVGTEEGIYKTTDGGLSFTHPLSSGYIETLAVANDNVAYAAFHSQYDTADGQVYKTTDGGDSWFQASTDLPVANLRLIQLKVDPNNPNRLYAQSGAGRFASGQNALFRSEDGGITWQKLLLPTGNTIQDFAPDPNLPNRLWVTTADTDSAQFGHLYRSDNAGNQFSEITRHGGTIWLLPGNSNTIRLFNVEQQWAFPDEQRDGVWQSLNGGQQWQQISQASDIGLGWQANDYIRTGWFHGVATRGEQLYWVNTQAVYASLDGGLSAQAIYSRQTGAGRWQSTGIDNAVIIELEADRSDNSVLWAGFIDMGIWRSDNQGLSWVSCNRAQDTGIWAGFGGNSWTILTDPDRAGYTWAAQGEDELSASVLLFSNNRGGNDCQQWTVIGNGLPAAPLLGLSLDNSQGGSQQKTLYVTAQGHVYRSNDDGLNWQQVFSNGGMRTTAVAQDGTVYAGGEYGIYRADDGQNFTNLSLAAMIGSINDLPLVDQWRGVSDVVPNPGINFPNRVYAVVHGVGVYKSEDRGAQWQLILNDPLAWKIAVSVHDENHLLVTSSSAFDHGGYDPATRGVWESLDGGQQWQVISNNLPWPMAMAVDFSLDNDYSYIGSPGAGIYRRANFDFVAADGFE